MSRGELAKTGYLVQDLKYLASTCVNIDKTFQITFMLCLL